MGGIRVANRWRVLATATAMVALGCLQALTAGPAAAGTPPDCANDAGNLVTNCGFETGDLTGWNTAGSFVFSGVESDEGLPHSGDNDMAFGECPPNVSTISQTISSVAASSTYELSFWLQTFDAGDGDDFTAVVQNTAAGTVTAAAIEGPTSLGYTEYDLLFRTQADGSDPVISFTGNNCEDWFRLDDVEVNSAHTVTFDTGGGLPTAGPQIVHDGDYATEPDDPELGGTDNIFEGWNTEPDGSGTWWFDFDEMPVTSDVTLYAQYDDPAPPEGGSTGGTQVTSSVAVLGVSPSQTVFGQPVTFTLNVAPASPVEGCSVLQWIFDGIQRGPDVPVTSGVPVAGGLQFTLSGVADLSVTQHNVAAFFPNCPAVSGAEVTELVVKAATSTTLSLADGITTAAVRAVAPGAGSPAGSVTFDIGGSPVTTVGLDTHGNASAALHVPNGEQVTAFYSGDDNFTPSAGALTGPGVVLNPAVAAQVHASHAARHGWYRSAVTVSFACKSRSSALTAPCPSAVRLSDSRAGQSVSRTVKATDGGQTTVTVHPINIDRVAPTLHVTRSGHHVSCHASDSLSGVASCVIHARHHTHGGVTAVHWTARASDKAGNVTTKTGHFAYVSP